MKVSIITAVLNGEKTIYDCIKTIAQQTYHDIEHIICDGGSTDKTIDIIKKWGIKNTRVISGPDNGPYDAMNKGIKASTGDIIAILNADDMYADTHVIENVVTTISEKKVDSCYGDLVYVDRKKPDSVIRYWKSGCYSREQFKKGWMPPHPTFFIKKSVYEKYGNFNTNFPIGADYEMSLRLLYKYNISTAYMPEVLVKMRTGGKSAPTLLNIAKAIIENYKAWQTNNLYPIPLTLILKQLSKLQQYKIGIKFQTDNKKNT